MNQEELLQELVYRELGRELSENAQVVDMDYPIRAAAAMGEIFEALREERVDSRTRMRRVQSIMLHYGVFGPRPAPNTVVEGLGKYLRKRDRQQEEAPVVPEKPRRGRPRKHPK